MKTSYKAIIFDMDGVLWNSTEIHRQAFEAVLAAYGFDRVDYHSIAGMTTPDAMRHLLRGRNISCDAATIDDLVRSKRQWALNKLSEAPPLMRNCQETLNALRHLRLGIATSGSRDSANAFIKATQSTKLFHSVITGEDVARSKPAPDIFQASFVNLNVNASETLIVEDSLHGIEAGRTAGADVAALIGTLTAEELQTTGATYIIEDLGELIQYGKQNSYGQGSATPFLTGNQP